MHHRRGGGEADGQSPLAGGETETEGHVGLACTAVAHGDHVLTSLDILASCQLVHELPVHRRDRKEVEGVQALDRREACSLDPSLDHAVMTVYELKFRQPEKVVGVIDTLGRAL